MKQLLAVLLCLVVQMPALLAQGSSLYSFTYQGRLNDANGPATGLFDFQFSLHAASTGFLPVGSTILRPLVPVTNGLFTVTLNFPEPNNFNGADRWLEITVKPGGVSTNYTTLSPRQQITSAPYAIRAASANSANSAVTAQGVTGPIPASQISGTISTGNLPPGVANAAPLAPGGIVMSDDPSNEALAAQGFARMPNAEIALAGEGWVQKNPPADKTEFIQTQGPIIVASVSTGTELIVFRINVFVAEAEEYRDEVIIYSAVTRQWRRATWLPAFTLTTGVKAVWTGTQVILWGGRVGRYDNDLTDDGSVFGGTVYDFPVKVITYSPASNQWAVTNGAGAVPRGRSEHSIVWTGTQMLVWGGTYFEYKRSPVGNGGFGMKLEASTHFATNGAAFNPATGQWTAISTAGAPSPRYGYAMVWTGNRMIVQGGTTNNNWVDEMEFLQAFAAAFGSSDVITGGSFSVYNATANDLVNSGYSYNPGTDTWSPIRSDGTAPRHAFGQSVWTGREMFVYGGKEPTFFPFLRNSDGTVGTWMLVPIRASWSYNPTNDQWTPRGVSDAGGPVWGGRRDFGMIWSGSEAIVYGGFGFNDQTYELYTRTNAQAYNMTTGTWQTLPVAPLDLRGPQAAWLGNQMVMFDNRTLSYSPTANAWSIEANYFGSPPLNPIDPSLVWTGKELILWGGMNNGVPSNRGRRYNPVTGLWTELSTTNAPAARTRHSAVWTGTRMVVWGGDGGGDPIYPAVVHWSGGAYDPVTDSWAPLATPPQDPVTGSTFARTGHKAVWTTHGMVIVGGSDGYNNQGQNFPHTLARLSPNLASWSVNANVPLEVGRYHHCLGTDGNRQIFLWGGQSQTDSDPMGDGSFLVDPATLSAERQDSADQPEPSRNPTMVWSGKEFIVWGGTGADGSPLGGGSKFDPDPARRYWTMANGGIPNIGTPHAGHAATWSGTEMLIWGGTTNTFGARYNPRSDAWTPMAVGPTMRAGGKSAWTGTNMLLYLPALPAPGSIPELWQYQPPVKTYLYLKL